MAATPKQLAARFAEVLNEWLTPEEMSIVRLRNEKQGSPLVCHSHDFCDANMAMQEAVEKLKLDHLPMDELTPIWNEAWAIAKAKKFFVAAIARDDDRRYVAAWTDGFAKPGAQVVDATFFAEDNGYDGDGIKAIDELEVGEIWQSDDYGNMHIIYRIS